MSSDADSSLARFARSLRVAHHVPGRIRLKLDGPLGPDMQAMAGEAKVFASTITRVAGIRSISLNILAKSCTVEYDPSVIPATAWEGVVSGNPAPGADCLLQSLITAARG